MKYKNMNGMGAGIPNNVRRGVYQRDGWRCALCDSTDGLQIHHVRPRGKGGADHPMNLITLCWRCHAAAHGSILQVDPWVAAEYKGRQDGNLDAAIREMMDDVELIEKYRGVNEFKVSPDRVFPVGIPGRDES